jgi:DNA-directed RNA polymerase subunit L
MKVLEKIEEKDTLRVLVDSNEESLFFLLKTYLEANSDVDIVGVYKEHHLIDKTEFFLKVKKGKPMEVFKKELAKVKKDLASKKVK